MIGRLKGAAMALMIVGSLIPASLSAASVDVVVERPWSRASIGTVRPGVAYMTIRNSGDQPVTLVGLKTDVAKMLMVHRTTTDASGVTKMAPAGDLTIPPGGSVELTPGGLHAMLMGLTVPLEEGTSYKLSLIFDDGGEVMIEVPVLGPAARGPDD